MHGGDLGAHVDGAGHHRDSAGQTMQRDLRGGGLVEPQRPQPAGEHVLDVAQGRLVGSPVTQEEAVLVMDQRGVEGVEALDLEVDFDVLLAAGPARAFRPAFG